MAEKKPQVNKETLSERVAELAGLTKKDAMKATHAVFEAIKEAVAEGKKVQILGFGGFESRPRSARKARNPQTGETVTVPATTVPAFKPGNGFKSVVK